MLFLYQKMEKYFEFKLAISIIYLIAVVFIFISLYIKEINETNKYRKMMKGEMPMACKPSKGKKSNKGTKKPKGK